VIHLVEQATDDHLRRLFADQLDDVDEVLQPRGVRGIPPAGPWDR